MTHEFSICNELRTLGITANYKGYKQAAWAIHLALDDERRLDDISKEIYQPIAQLFFCYIKIQIFQTWNVLTTRFRINIFSFARRKIIQFIQSIFTHFLFLIENIQKF